MSKRLISFLVSELDRVRIVCPRCGAASEMTVEQLAGNQNHGCKFCNSPPGAPDSLGDLARAIVFLKRYKDTKVEFVLPDDGN